MKQQQVFFHPSVIIRAPILPFHPLFSEEDLMQWSGSPLGHEALLVASADFLQEIRHVQGRLPRPLRRTLTNYYSRACSRCTPFGLFAGCGVVGWGPVTDLELNSGQFRRHARPDMEWLRRLTQYLETDVFREQLRFAPNTSLHVIGQQIRYIEMSYEGTAKRYALRSADRTPELETLLDVCRRRAATLTELTAVLTGRGFSEADSAAYVEALVDAQVLESDLTPNVTGEPYFSRVSRLVNAFSSDPDNDPICQWFKALQSHFDQINETLHPHPATVYEAIHETARRVNLPCEANKLIQVDMGLSMNRSMLDSHLQGQLMEAVEVMRIFQPTQPQTDLDTFREAFYEQYEERFVPLTEVLDVDNGLGFPVGNGRFYSELSDQINLQALSPDETLLRQNAVSRYLYDRLREAEQRGDTVIRLERRELAPFEANAQPLPPSATVTFRLLPDSQVLFEGLSGGSGLYLLTRFAHFDETIHQVCTDIVEHEETANPNVIFAEIVHLPEDRIGNILMRPAFRTYEIPYLSAPGVSPETCIRFDELLLGVRRNRLVLYCERLKKEIIPRLSSAQNFRRAHLPLFRFLCELKAQGLFTNVVFDWTTVVPPRYFYPRLTYGQIVLSPARWQLPRSALSPLLAADAEQLMTVFADWADRWRLPRFFVWLQGDNELLICRDNPLTVSAWLDSIRSLETIELKEFMLSQGDDSPLRDAQGRPHAHQFMATLLNPQTVYDGRGHGFDPAHSRFRQPPARRQFWPGSEWFYCKVYCGWNVRKHVLHTWLVPFVKELQQKGIGQQWFFVNYEDPEPHIRLRVRLQTPDFMTEVYRILIESGDVRDVRHSVRKIQIDTYERELERYGPHLIEQAEWLFWQDSEAVVALPEPDTDDTIPVWLRGIGCIDYWLGCADFTVTEKLAFAQRVADAFSPEFPPTPDNRRQLNDLYRRHRPDVTRLLTENSAWMEPLRMQEAQRRTMLRQIRNRCEDFPRLLGSYIHLFLNRLNPVEQRLHEYTYYYFLTKAYKTILATAPTQKNGLLN